VSVPAHADEAGLAAAARLRLEFDRAFAATPSAGAGVRTAYLAIRIGGDPFALLLSDLLGVHVDRKVVPVPSATPTLLGIASFRGALTPVHDLRLVLGYPARAAARWLARIAGDRPIALAFEALEGQFTVVHADIDVSGAAANADAHANASADTRAGADARRASAGAAAYTRAVVQSLDGLRPVIDVAPVLATLAGNLGPIWPATER
jgi:chemotaxis signal transduction protein